MDRAAGLWITPFGRGRWCQHDRVISDAAWRRAGYVAEELLGYGASGEVWRGRVAHGGEPVALKILHLRDGAALRSAQAEAALLSMLDHPNLIRLRELFADGDHAVLVLDLAEGGSLAEVLERRGRLTAGEVVSALAPIAAALAYLHEQGIVHADVSSSNVLFTADAVSLLADLGVARLLSASEPARSTLAYLDPAVAAGGAAGPATDVFMLAGVALHALTGRAPWIGISADELIDAAAVGDIAGLEQLLAPVPSEVADVVRRGLCAGPHGRGTAAEFALDLRHAIAPVPVDLAAGRTKMHAHGPDPDPAGADGAAARPGFTTPAPRPLGPVRGAGGGPHTPRHAHDRENSGVQARVSEPLELDRPDFSRPARDLAGGRRAPRRGRASSMSLPTDPADRGHHTVTASPAGVDVSDRVAALSLTHGVRARTRPPEPAPRPVRSAARMARASARTIIVIGSVITGVALLGVAAMAWAHGGSPARHAKSARPPTNARAGSTLASTPHAPADIDPTVSPTPTSVSPSVATSSASAAVGSHGRASWRTILVALDRRRERAFATRDPDTLTAVYSSSALAAQDRATLRRVVPPHCRLTGVRTTYTALRVISESDRSVRLRVTASLAAGTLRCPGLPLDRTLGRPEVTLTIRLARLGPSFAIAAQAVG